MKFLALAAIASAMTLDIEEGRKLGGVAANEESAWNAWLEAQKDVARAQAKYLKAKAAARHQEGELQREIDETIKQEAVVKRYNDAANAARKAFFKATFRAHKAFEAYAHAMTEPLTYTK